MKRTMILFVALFAIVACQTSAGQDYVTTPADVEVADDVLGQMTEAFSKSRASGTVMTVPELMTFAAERLLGTGYVAGTLEEDPANEQLRLYLTKTDCILFVETCLGLARAVSEKGGRTPSFDDFAAQVAGTRYRCKAPYTYGDRIHYTTEWIRRQEADGRLKDITLDLGGEVYDHPIHFMTRHSGSYRQLADSSANPNRALDLEKVGEAEDGLNLQPMTYVPKAKVAAAAKGIKTGDIICYVSSVEGLDIAHVAIAYVRDGVAGFIHASQADGKVEIDRRTIEEYVGPRSNLSGIKVVRPL